MKSIFLNNLLLLLLLSTNSFSKEWDFLSINGYGSFGLAYQKNKDFLYRNSFQSKRGSQGDVSFSNYSNLGLQLDAHPTSNLTFTLQGILNDNNSVEEGLFELAWANLHYRINDNWNIKVGKMRLTSFMDSDILNVGYSYDMVHLPTMYSSIPFHNYTGLEVNHRADFDEVVLLLNLFYGQSDSYVYNNYLEKGLVELKHMKGIVLKVIYDKLTLRIEYNRNNLTINNQETDTEISQLSNLDIPIITQTFQKYGIKEIESLAIGAEYEWDNSYIKSEYIKLNTHSFLADMHSWYINIGYEFENWSPYILYSRTHSTSAFKGIPIESTMPPALLGAINRTNEGLQYAFDSTNVNADISSIGFRYNLTDNSVFKFQYEYLDTEDFINQNTKKKTDAKIHLFSTTINFVF